MDDIWHSWSNYSKCGAPSSEKQSETYRINQMQGVVNVTFVFLIEQTALWGRKKSVLSTLLREQCMRVSTSFKVVLKVLNGTNKYLKQRHKSIIGFALKHSNGEVLVGISKRAILD